MMSRMSLLERLLNGDIGLHELETEVTAGEAAEVRRQALETWTSTSLDEVGSEHDLAEATSNVENAVGATRVPLGVAGPLEVDGRRASGGYYVPMATTEGALVASTNRGCSAVTESGCVSVRVVGDAMTRAPAFRVSDVEEAARLSSWVEAEGLERLREAAGSTTDHGRLEWVRPYVMGDVVYLRMGFDTSDAMGMNMVTIASREAARVVEAEFDASLVALSGNVCVDKKPAAINAVEGRGKSVQAEAVLSSEAVESKLKTSVEDLLEVHRVKTLMGSVRSGSLSANAHAANVVAAVFLATGQDVAQVVEASSAYTVMSRRDGGVYVGVTLPALELGTVGGGTSLPTQREALSLLGVEGGGDGERAEEFAEVVAAAVLAGEVSLHAAIASDTLDSSHEELGR
ncbi:MAG: hydroxymethylglutaryl-CoA reductase (NADPH) [Halobacteriales archaeon]